MMRNTQAVDKMYEAFAFVVSNYRGNMRAVTRAYAQKQGGGLGSPQYETTPEEIEIVNSYLPEGMKIRV